ncbi:MAG: RtcB family protein [Candidatus Omnitrophica bacterium]|nr:RtcB family protein [Candidatus Omnitrophota bacterium]
MKARELIQMGIPPGECKRLAIVAVAEAAKAGVKKSAIKASVQKVIEDPEGMVGDPIFGELASRIGAAREARARYEDRAEPAPSRIWGEDLDPESLEQMKNACSLPVSVRGALMPDAHLGYGLPIGGVLATRNSVIPYAVGVDIACRMKMTVLDLPTSDLDRNTERLIRAIEDETRFGIGAEFKGKWRQHEVMDEDWSFSKVVSQKKDKAWAQLGTSGSGNHFVEFGTLTLEQDDLGLEAGTYLALLSHSGSRGTGATIADSYSKLAMDLHPELPKQLRHLAWLDLDDDSGREYWMAMELMGKYAAANHDCIHRHIRKHLHAELLLDIENHHNFAWKEIHDGEEVIVHRKGATPAGEGVLGIIPGSMASPGYVVRGKGNEDSLKSASHGAGRQMSRKRAKESFTWHEVKNYLEKKNVRLLSAGLDEVPMAYKNIEAVMSQQQDLVDIVARFDPRLVKMAPAGEKPED